MFKMSFLLHKIFGFLLLLNFWLWLNLALPLIFMELILFL